MSLGCFEVDSPVLIVDTSLFPTASEDACRCPAGAMFHVNAGHAHFGRATAAHVLKNAGTQSTTNTTIRLSL